MKEKRISLIELVLVPLSTSVMYATSSFIISVFYKVSLLVATTMLRPAHNNLCGQVGLANFPRLLSCERTSRSFPRIHDLSASPIVSSLMAISNPTDIQCFRFTLLNYFFYHFLLNASSVLYYIKYIYNHIRDYLHKKKSLHPIEVI